MKRIIPLAILATLLLAPQPAHGTPHYSTATTKRLMLAEARAHHVGLADRKALVKLAMRESSLRNWCRTGSYVGVLQIRLTPFQRRANKWWKPKWCTHYALKEIRHKYGTVRAALAHSNRFNWY